MKKKKNCKCRTYTQYTARMKYLTQRLEFDLLQILQHLKRPTARTTNPGLTKVSTACFGRRVRNYSAKLKPSDTYSLPLVKSITYSFRFLGVWTVCVVSLVNSKPKVSKFSFLANFLLIFFEFLWNSSKQDRLLAGLP